MVRTLALAAGLAISASAAQAAFTGLTYLEGDSAAATAVLGQNATVIQIFAAFDGLGDGFNNTAVNSSFVSLVATSGTFYQDGFGTDLPPNEAFFPLAPSLEFDTYGTIGASVLGDGGSISVEPGTAMDTTSIVGGWFSSDPPSNIGAAQMLSDGSFGTLLFQITILNGATSIAGALESMLFGTITVIGPDVDNVGDTFEIETLVNPVPTPGSLALFGIAGLAATRRRRG